MSTVDPKTHSSQSGLNGASTLPHAGLSVGRSRIPYHEHLIGCSQRHTRLETCEAYGGRRVGKAAAERRCRTECSVAIAKQHGHRLGKAVGSGNVQHPISVEVRQHQRWNKAKGGAALLAEHPRRGEVSIAVIQNDFDDSAFFNREVRNAVVVEVARGEAKEDSGKDITHHDRDEPAGKCRPHCRTEPKPGCRSGEEM